MASHADKRVEAVFQRLCYLKSCVVENIVTFGMWSKSNFLFADFEFRNDAGEYKLFEDVEIVLETLLRGDLLALSKEMVKEFETTLDSLREDWYMYWVEEGIRELVEEEVSENERLKIH